MKNATRVFTPTTRRSGFTLLELLIAVGLTSLLMISLFSALQIYFDLQMDSHEEITRQQVARTLLRQITRDVQSVVFVKKTVTDDETDISNSSSTSSSTGSSVGSNSGSTGSGSTSGSGNTGASGSSGSSASGSSSSGTITSSGSGSLDGNLYGSSTIDPETVLTTYTNGLIGSSTDLQLFVSRPDRTLSYVTAQELASTSDRTSDLMIVRYFMADSGGGGLSAKVAERESLGNNSGAIGLAKMQGDLYGLSTAMETSEELPQLNASVLLAKEVSVLTFRYYDGVNWQESWDSNALNEMPKAVEITLRLRNPEEAADALAEEEDDLYAVPETTHRMVVPIPVAEPFVTESAL